MKPRFRRQFITVKSHLNGGMQVSRYVISLNAKAMDGKERPVMQVLKHLLHPPPLPLFMVSEYNRERENIEMKVFWFITVEHWIILH